jgi:hypothetical protein
MASLSGSGASWKPRVKCQRRLAMFAAETGLVQAALDLGLQQALRILEAAIWVLFDPDIHQQLGDLRAVAASVDRADLDAAECHRWDLKAR